jgi:hypothetical protein
MASTVSSDAHNVHTIAELPARTNGPHRAPRDVTWDGGYPTRRIRYAVPAFISKARFELRTWRVPTWIRFGMRYRARPEHDFERKLGRNAHYLHSIDSRARRATR